MKDRTVKYPMSKKQITFFSVAGMQDEKPSKLAD